MPGSQTTTSTMLTTTAVAHKSAPSLAMRKCLFSFIVTLLVIVISISYLGTFNQESSNQFSILIKKPPQPPPHSKLLDSIFASSETATLRHNFVAKYPHATECNIADDHTFRPYQTDDEYDSSGYNYSLPAPNSTHALRITRAVLVYFPVEQLGEYALEFKWLYRSWAEMLAHEPARWRTDLVVFVSDEGDAVRRNETDALMRPLNCSFGNRRRSVRDAPMCTLIAYTPLKSRRLARHPDANPELRTNKERYEYVLTRVDIFDDAPPNLELFYRLVKDKLANYGYLDSILMAFDGHAYLKSAGYHFLVRSDMDVFLTPLFARWLPRHCNDFYVGRGGYSTVFNVNRLERVAKHLGLAFAAEMNLGSTWYSTPDQFRLVAYLTLFGMSYLAEEEFSQPEREGKVGVMLWPYWHYGVVLLYGQNLAMNHLMKTRQLRVVKLEDQLDYPSYYADPVDRMIHIHVFHGDDMFSKFKFKAGAYDALDYADKDVRVAKFYALKMALEAKRSAPEALCERVRNETRRKI